MKWSSGTTWTTIDSNTSTRLVTGGFGTYSVRSNGDLYRYDGTGTNWTRVGGPATAFAVSADALYAHDITGSPAGVYKWTSGTTWERIGGPATAIYAGGLDLFAKNNITSDIYRYNGVAMDWTKVGGPGSAYVVNANGLYGLNSAGVFQFTGHPDYWVQIGGAADAIYGGGNNLCAKVPLLGDIHCYGNAPSTWSKAADPVTSFVVCDDAFVSTQSNGCLQKDRNDVDPDPPVDGAASRLRKVRIGGGGNRSRPACSPCMRARPPASPSRTWTPDRAVCTACGLSVARVDLRRPWRIAGFKARSTACAGGSLAAAPARLAPALGVHGPRHTSARAPQARGTSSRRPRTRACSRASRKTSSSVRCVRSMARANCSRSCARAGAYRADRRYGLTPGRVIRQLLARMGMLESLEVAIFSDEIGVPKPHPLAFERALSALGTSARGAAHVGDLRRSDARPDPARTRACSIVRLLAATQPASAQRVGSPVELVPCRCLTDTRVVLGNDGRGWLARCACVLLIVGCGGAGGPGGGASAADASADSGTGRAGTDVADPADGGAGRGGSGGSGPGSGAAGSAGDAGAAGDGGTQPGTDAGGAGSDGAVAMGCDAWERDLATDNRLYMQRRAFLLGSGILQGTLGPFVADPGYAVFHVTRVWNGVQLFEGEDFVLRMNAELHASVADAAEVVVALPNSTLVSTATLFPEIDGRYPLPRWVTPPAVLSVPVAPEFEPLIDYRGHPVSHVAAARVTAVTNREVTFEVDDPLHGDLTAGFNVYWPSHVPRPEVSDARYLVSVNSMQTAGGVTNARLLDIRRDSPAERTRISAALAAAEEPDHPYAVLRAEDAEAREQTEHYRQTFWFHISNMIAVAELAGRARPSDGISIESIVSNRVAEVLTGSIAESDHFLTSTYEPFAAGECGSRFLFGLDRFTALEPTHSARFACEAPLPAAPALGRFAGVRARIPATAENLELARDAVRSAPPLFLLHPADQAFEADLVAPERALGPWSAPLPTQAALHFEMIRIHIDQVIEHPGGYEVQLSSTFSDDRSFIGPDAEPSPPPTPLRLFFQCGDPRLLEVGAYWLVPAILAQSQENVDAGKPFEELIAARQFFVIPGTLLPARWDTYQNIELYLP